MRQLRKRSDEPFWQRLRPESGSQYGNLEKKEKALELMKLPDQFAAEECGHGPKLAGKVALAKRLECLERVRLQYPPLPLALEVPWARRKEDYCKRLPEYEKEATGLTFINAVNIVVATLGKHYGGTSA